jgi:Resolvase, N terminal domain
MEIKRHIEASVPFYEDERGRYAEPRVLAGQGLAVPVPVIEHNDRRREIAMLAHELAEILFERPHGTDCNMALPDRQTAGARDLVAQELGLLTLIKRGVRVLTSTGDDMTDTSDPSRIMMRQIAGSFAQYEKARLVGKLRKARERKRAANGKRAASHTPS